MIVAKNYENTLKFVKARPMYSKQYTVHTRIHEPTVNFFAVLLQKIQYIDVLNCIPGHVAECRHEIV